jgi:hypothetical protein
MSLPEPACSVTTAANFFSVSRLICATRPPPAIASIVGIGHEAEGEGTMRSASIALMASITAFTGISASPAMEPVRLKQAPGLDKVEAHCAACHSLDYVQMNSPFLSETAWDAEVAKMINAFGAPIPQAEAKIIVDYLNKNYGTESLDALPARSGGSKSSSERGNGFPGRLSSSFRTAQENFDTEPSGTPRIMRMPRRMHQATLKHHSVQNERAFCLFCIPWVRPVSLRASSSLHASVRRSALYYVR